MNLIKQYIIQCIVSAANNLRLSTEKIEVVALLREEINRSVDLEKIIQEMKKITELSTFAIKLSEIYYFLSKSKIDFLKLSEKFKEHCSYIVKDLNTLLEKISPQSYRHISINIKEHINAVTPEIEYDVTQERKGLVLEEVKEITKEEITEKKKAMAESEKLKEDFILDIEDNNDEVLFEKFEERILNPIKSIDRFLREISPDRINQEELETFYKVMEKNAEVSLKIGFEIIANMHSIFAKALLLIKSKSILPVKDVIEGMRACLIVIVAVVRGKEVDITYYLNRAENFGKQIMDIN